ncbi:MAG: matrixin family metalloprotease [Dehalococcoidia bacterium]|nr:matrixin family metalloprotease [Dehalococcoidia bacterium]
MRRTGEAQEAAINRTSMARVHRWRAWWLLSLTALVVAVAVLTGPASSAPIAEADGPAPARGVVRYDREGTARTGVFARLVDDAVFQPLVKYLTDCEGPGSTSDCGGAPARWRASALPIEVCTAQGSRPGGLSAEEFRAAVAAAVTTWNAQEFAGGIRYRGDCSNVDFWVFNNLRNEIGWDDSRRALSGTQAAVTRSTLPLVGGVREIREADVVLDPALARVPRVCLESTIVHELGHLLGFGHSDDRGDLMYPSFDPSALATCKVTPTASERDRMQALYGIDRAPTVTVSGGGAAEPSAVVIATAVGTDPEGGPLQYEWQQVSGPIVPLITEGATARFVAPAEPGGTVTLRVTALDPYGHAASAQAVFVVGASGAAPGVAPSLETFLAGTDGNASLGWTPSAGAVTYELCSRPAGLAVEFECTPVAEPRVSVSWDTVLGANGRAADHRVIALAERETYLRGCNAQGCSAPGTGGLTGGLRWAQWGIDYDYLVFAYDVGGVQFTIAGIVNVSGEARSFTVGTGPVAEPGQHRLTSCGRIQPGQVCFAFSGPGGRHGEYVDILTEAPDRPTTEHRVRVR